MQPVTDVIKFPTLTHLTIEFEDPDSECFHFLAHIPVEGLRTLDSTWQTSTDDTSGLNKEDFHSLVEPFIRRLCAALGSDAGGRVKFPNLMKGLFTLFRKDFPRDKSFKGVVLERQVSELQKRLPDLRIASATCWNIVQELVLSD